MAEDGSLGDLVDVRDAGLVVIHDVWVGYNNHSPIVGVWELRRASSAGLVGQGRLSTAIAGERVVDVAIAAKATDRFLDAIAGARIMPGQYDPFIAHTDDSPCIEIALHVGVRDTMRRGGIALLFTESQGKFHAPWGASVGGQVLTLPGEEIGRALAALRVPLKRGILDRMTKETDDTGAAKTLRRGR